MTGNKLRVLLVESSNADAQHTLSNALQFALPIIGVLLITNLALGILTCSAPQLNIFTVGFPITIAVGFATLMLILPTSHR